MGAREIRHRKYLPFPDSDVLVLFMAGLPPDDPYAPYLREIAGMSVSLARDLFNRASETQDNGEAVRLAGAFHKVTRGLRQTIALVAKLEQDYARAEREAKPERDRQHE